MKIAVVAPECHPFVDDTGKGHVVRRFVEEFASLGHDVVVVIPFPSGQDMDAYSLAKRLVPITVDVDGESMKIPRYDGRTPIGTPIHLLELESGGKRGGAASWSPLRIEAFGRAAGALLDGLNSPVNVCFSFGGEAAFVPVATHQGEGTNGPIHVLVVDDGQFPEAPLRRGMDAANRIILADREVERVLRGQDGGSLFDLAQSRRAVTLKRPTGEAPGPFKAEGVSKKVALQIQKGLPVRADVPLFCFMDTGSDIITASFESLMKRDVQVVVPKSLRDRAGLADRYPDRLVTLSGKDDVSEVIAASDVYVVGEEREEALRAISLRTLPLVGPGLAEDFVDLEPSCRTGSAVIADELSVSGFEDAFARMISAFARADAVYLLCHRLPGFVPTWKSVAGHYLQAAQSIQLQSPLA